MHCFGDQRYPPKWTVQILLFFCDYLSCWGKIIIAFYGVFLYFHIPTVFTDTISQTDWETRLGTVRNGARTTICFCTAWYGSGGTFPLRYGSGGRWPLWYGSGGTSSQRYGSGPVMIEIMVPTANLINILFLGKPI